MLGQDLERGVQKETPANLKEQKQHCEEERANIALQWCERLIK